MTKIFTSIILVLLILSISLISSPSVAYACSCAPPPSVEEELERKTAVFSGRVIEIFNPNNTIYRSSADPINVLIEVDSIWKGIHTTQVIVHTAESSASCGFNFDLNTEYLVYAYGEKDHLETGLCERTTPLAAAADDLSILGNGQNPTEQVQLEKRGLKDASPHSFIWIMIITLFFILIAAVFIRKIRRS